MKNELRLSRLHELRSMLLNHNKLFPEIKFNMDHWKCGTAACALGSACLHKPFSDKGLKVHANSVTYKHYEDYEAGEEFFGITSQESDWLFNPERYRTSKGGFFVDIQRSVKPKHVARRVTMLIDKYQRYNPMYLHNRAGL